MAHIIIQSLAPSLLGAFIEPASLRSLTGTWSGSMIEARDLKLRPEGLASLGLRLKAGSIGHLRLTIPGGLAGLAGRLYHDAIRLELHDVFLLVDNLPMPKRDEALRSASSHASLDIDASVYRQRLLSIIEQALQEAGTMAGAAGAERATSSAGLVEAIAAHGQLELTGLHVRYEDATLRPDAPFAVGVTLARFATQGADDARSSATASTTANNSMVPPPLPYVSGLQYHDARLEGLAVYWDPLDVRHPGTWLSNMQSNSEWAAAMSAGIAAGGGGGGSANTILTSPAPSSPGGGSPGTLHNYILTPTDAGARIALNWGSKVAGEPMLRGALRGALAFGISSPQLRGISTLASFAGKRDEAVALLRLTPSVPFKAALADIRKMKLEQVARTKAAAARGALTTGLSPSILCALSMNEAIASVRAYLKLHSGDHPRPASSRTLATKTSTRHLSASTLIPGAPAQSPMGEWFTYAAACALVAAGRPLGVLAQPNAAARARWSLARVAGSNSARKAYQDAYGKVLMADATAFEKSLLNPSAPAPGGVAGTVDKATTDVIAAIEATHVEPQIFAFRDLARAEVETRIKMDKKVGSAPSGWFGMFMGGKNNSSSSSSKKLIPPHSPRAANATVEEETHSTALAEINAQRGMNATTFMSFTVDLELASLTIAGDGPTDVLAVAAFSGRARYEQTAGKSWNAQLGISTFNIIDKVTHRTAYERIVRPLADDGAVDAKLLSITIVAAPLDAPNTDMRIRVDSQPLLLIFAPALLRRLAAFAATVVAVPKDEVASRTKSAVPSTVAADTYASLSSTLKLDVDVRIAAPVLLLPSDAQNSNAAALELCPGTLRLSSSTPAEEVARRLDTLAIGDIAGEARLKRAFVGAGTSSAEQQAGRDYQTWRLELVGVRASIVEGNSATHHLTPVISDISLDVAVQTCIQSSTLVKTRARAYGALPRVNVAVSVGLVQVAGALLVSLSDLSAGIAADAALEAALARSHRIQAEAAAVGDVKKPIARRVLSSAAAAATTTDANATTTTTTAALAFSALMEAEQAAAVVAAEEGTTETLDSSGVSIVSFSIGEVALSLYDVRSVARAMLLLARAEARAAANPSPEHTTRASGYFSALRNIRSAAMGSSSSSPELMIALKALTLDATVGASATVALGLGGLEMNDNVVGSPGDVSRFISSTFRPAAVGLLASVGSSGNDDETLEGRLIALHLSYSPIDGMELALALGHLHVGYNPTTIAALRLYGDAIGRLIAGETAVVIKPISSNNDIPVSSITTNTAPSTSAPSSLIASSSTTSSSHAPNSDIFASTRIDQLGSLVQTMLQLSASDPVTAIAAASIRIVAQIDSLTFSLNAGSGLQAGSIAHLAILSVGVSFRADKAGGSVIHARLGELALLDALSGDPKHPLLLARALPDAAHRASAAPLLVARVYSAAPRILSPDNSILLLLPMSSNEPLRIDTDVSLTLSPLRYVHVHSTLMSVIEYATTGLLGTLLSSSAQLAGETVAAAAASAAAAESRLRFSIALGGIAVSLPKSRESHRALTATLGAVELSNTFENEKTESTSLSIAGLSLFAAGAHGRRAPILTPISIHACVKKVKAAPLDISLDFPGAALTVAPQLAALLMDTLTYNIGAKTDGRAGATPVALASELLQESDDAHNHKDVLIELAQEAAETAAAAAAAAAATVSMSRKKKSASSDESSSAAIKFSFKVPGAVSVCLADAIGAPFAIVSLSSVTITGVFDDGRLNTRACASLALSTAEAHDALTLTDVITGRWPIDVNFLIRRADGADDIPHTALAVKAAEPLCVAVSDVLLSRLLTDINVWMAIAFPTVVVAAAVPSEIEMIKEVVTTSPQPSIGVTHALTDATTTSSSLTPPTSTTSTNLIPTLSISINVPLVALDVAIGVMGSPGARGTAKVLVRVAIVGLDAAYATFAVTSGGSVGVARAGIAALHIADALSYASARAHGADQDLAADFVFLVTSAPIEQRVTLAALLLGETQNLGVPIDGNALLSLAGVQGGALIDVSFSALAGNAKGGLHIESVKDAVFSGFNIIDNNEDAVCAETEAANLVTAITPLSLPSCDSEVSVIAGVAIDISWHAKTVVSLLRWIAAATTTTSGGAHASHSVPSTNDYNMSASPTASSPMALSSTSTALSPPPPTPTAPTTIAATKNQSSMLTLTARGIAISLCHEFQAVTLAILNVSTVVAGILSRDGNTEITASIGVVRLIDVAEGTVHAELIAPDTTEKVVDDDADSVSSESHQSVTNDSFFGPAPLIEVAFSMRPNGGGICAINIGALRVTYIARFIDDVLDYLLVTILGPFAGPQAPKRIPEIGLPYPRAVDSEATALILRIRVAAPTILLPASAKDADALKLTVTGGVTVETLFTDVPLTAAGEVGMCAVSILRIAVGKIELCALACGAQTRNIDIAGVEVNIRSFLDARAAAAEGGILSILLPSLNLAMPKPFYSVLMRMLSENLGAPPTKAAAGHTGCVASFPGLPAPHLTFDEKRHACTVCAAVFSAVRLRLRCEVSGCTVCLSCIAGRVWDPEAGASKQACAPCVARIQAANGIVGGVPLHTAAVPLPALTAAATLESVNESSSPLVVELPAARFVVSVTSPRVRVSLISPPKRVGGGGGGGIYGDDELLAAELIGLSVTLTSDPGTSRSEVNVIAVRVSDERRNRPKGAPASRALLAPRLTVLFPPASLRVGAPHLQRVGLSPQVHVVHINTGGKATLDVDLVGFDVVPELEALSAVGSWFSTEEKEIKGGGSTDDIIAATITTTTTATTLPDSPDISPETTPVPVPDTSIPDKNTDELRFGAVTYQKTSLPSTLAISLRLNDVRAVLIGGENHGDSRNSLVARLSLQLQGHLVTHAVSPLVVAHAATPSSGPLGIVASSTLASNSAYTSGNLVRARVQRSSMSFKAYIYEATATAGTVSLVGDADVGNACDATWQRLLALLPWLDPAVKDAKSAATAADIADVGAPADACAAASVFDGCVLIGSGDAILSPTLLTLTLQQSAYALIGVDTRTLIDLSRRSLWPGDANAPRPAGTPPSRIDPTRTLAVGPLPPSRTAVNLSFGTNEPLTLTVPLPALSMLQGVVTAWSSRSTLAVEEMNAESPRQLDGETSLTMMAPTIPPPITTSTKNKVASEITTILSSPSPFTRPRGWHPDDYEVLIPTGAKWPIFSTNETTIGLEEFDVELSASKTSIAGRIVIIEAKTPDSSLPSSSSQSLTFAYDAGNGAVEPQSQSALSYALAYGLIEPGDVIIAVNGKVVAGNPIAAIMEVLTQAGASTASVSLRLRRLPISAAIDTDEGIELVLRGAARSLARARLANFNIRLALAPSRGLSTHIELSPAALVAARPADRDVSVLAPRRVADGSGASHLASLLAALSARPAGMSLYASASLTLGLEVRGSPFAWEPLLQPLIVGARVTALDAGGSSLPIAVFRGAVGRTDITVSRTILSALDTLSAALASTVASTGIRADALAGTAILARRAPTGFPYLIRNESGAPLALALYSSRGKGASGAIFSLISKSPALHGHTEDTSTTSPTVATTSTTITNEAPPIPSALLSDMDSRGTLALCVLPPGCEVGLSVTHSKEFSEVAAEGGNDISSFATAAVASLDIASFPPEGTPSNIAAAYWAEAVEMRWTSAVPLETIGHCLRPLLAADPSAPAPAPATATESGLGGAALISLNLPSRLVSATTIVTLRSIALVVNSTVIALRVRVLLTSPSNWIDVGIAQPGTRLPLPLWLASSALAVAVTPGEAGDSYAMPSPSSAVALHGRGDSSGFAHVHGAGDDVAALTFAWRIEQVHGGVVTAIVFAAPLRLENRLPIEMDYECVGAPGGRLAPGESAELFAGGDGARDAVRARPKGCKWAPWLKLATANATEARVECPAPPATAGGLEIAVAAVIKTELVSFPSAGGGSVGNTAAAVRVPGGKSLVRIVTFFTDLWIIDATGLPFALGCRGGHAIEESGRTARAPSLRPLVTNNAAAAAAETTSAIEHPVTDDVWENERYHFIRWGDPLLGERPRWSAENGQRQHTKEEIEAALPRGWRWTTDWVADAWDHAPLNFETLSRTNPLGRAPRPYSFGDIVRRRRWTRTRVPPPPPPPPPSPSCANCAPAMCVGACGGRNSSSGGGGGFSNAGENAFFPLIQEGRIPGAPFGTLAIASTGPIGDEPITLHSAAFSTLLGSEPPPPIVTPFKMQGKGEVFIRVANGPWSEGVAVVGNETAPTALSGVGASLRILGESATGGAAAYDVLLLATDAAAPFERTHCVTIVPRYTVENATGSPLWIRQAGAAQAPPLRIPAYSSAPLWWPVATAPSALQVASSASGGAWSTPIGLTLPEGVAFRAAPLAIPVIQEGLTHAFHSSVGPAPLGVTIVGVTLRTRTDASGGVAITISQQLHHRRPLRVLPDAVTSSANPTDVVSLSLIMAHDRDAMDAAAADAAKKFKAKTMGEEVVSNLPQDIHLIASPFLALLNHSSCTLAIMPHNARAWSADGLPLSEADVRSGAAELARGHAADLTRVAQAPLGAVWASAAVYAEPGAIIPLGLADVDLGKNDFASISVRVAGVGGRGGLVFGAPVAVDLGRLGVVTPNILSAPSRSGTPSVSVTLSLRLSPSGLVLVAVDSGSGGVTMTDAALADAVDYGAANRDALWAHQVRVGAGDAAILTEEEAATAEEVSGGAPHRARAWATRATITVEEIGVSVADTRCASEFAYLSLRGAAVSVEATSAQLALRASIDALQIDDQFAKSERPVVLTCGAPPSMRMLEASVDATGASAGGVLHVKKAALGLQPIKLHLSWDFFSRLMHVVDELVGPGGTVAATAAEENDAALDDGEEGQTPQEMVAGGGVSSSFRGLPAVDTALSIDGVAAPYVSPAEIFAAATRVPGSRQKGSPLEIARKLCNPSQTNVSGIRAFIESMQVSPLKVILDYDRPAQFPLPSDDPLALFFATALGVPANELRGSSGFQTPSLKKAVLSIIKGISLTGGSIIIDPPNVTIPRFLSVGDYIAEVIRGTEKTLIAQVLSLVSHSNALGNVGANTSALTRNASAATDAMKRGDVIGVLGSATATTFATGNLVAGGLLSLGVGATGLVAGSADALQGIVSTGASPQEDVGRRLNKAISKKVGSMGGFSSALAGLASGLSGAVLDPINGLKRDGVRGLATGLISGTTGILFRPIAGIVGGVSIAVQGLKDTASDLSDRVAGAAGQKSDAVFDQNERRRLPRPFYAPISAAARAATHGGTWTLHYDIALASIYDALRQMAHGRNKELKLMVKEPTVHYDILADGSTVLVTTGHVLVIRDDMTYSNLEPPLRLDQIPATFITVNGMSVSVRPGANQSKGGKTLVLQTLNNAAAITLASALQGGTKA